MDSSTPKRKDLRRSIFQVSVSSPLRRSLGPPPSATSVIADDEKERANRRSMVAMQKRLSSIASPLTDGAAVLDEQQIQEHLKICAKLYTENRISAKNAWQLNVIDVIRRIALSEPSNVFQVAGSSLDIGAKVYSLRVDDAHAKGLQLAGSLSKGNEGLGQQENEEGNNDNTISGAERRRAGRKRVKKLAADKRSIIDKDKKTLFSSIKHIESVVFATKENIEVSATDNLFTNKLPVNPETHRIMLLSNEKYWSCKRDEDLEVEDKVLDIELPQVSHFNLCQAFKDFEIGTWSVEEEEKLLGETQALPAPVLDENGIPIAELDGSIHDIFEDCNDVPEDPVTDNEEQDVFQVQLHGEINHIVDAVPEENRVETDYGFNTLVKTSNGKYIDKIWAGPSHWKVKFNRRSTARYSGATDEVVRHVRRNKREPKRIDFSQEVEDLSKTLGEYVPRRQLGTTALEKITLPVPEITAEDFQNQINHLFLKPPMRRPRINRSDYEVPDVPVYNYDNDHDSLYCSQNGIDDAYNEPEHNKSFEEAVPAAQQQFLDDNLVNAPETVASSNLPYAMQAKKMDMKKLKSAVWKCLTGDEKFNGRVIEHKRMSTLYKQVPHLLSSDMKKDLSFPLVFLAILHLCNENHLNLSQESGNTKDFTIYKDAE